MQISTTAVAAALPPPAPGVAGSAAFRTAPMEQAAVLRPESPYLGTPGGAGAGAGAGVAMAPESPHVFHQASSPSPSASSADFHSRALATA